jgi:RNA polymerase sigma factor (sigma-70 family)
MTLHHNPGHLRAVGDDWQQTAARQRPLASASELEQTMAAAASHSPWAWSALVERFGARVRGVARRYGLGAHDVDDVAQATWLRLYERIRDVREPEAVGGWLETTARRESLRVLRSGSREQLIEGEIVGLEPDEPVNERRLVAAERDAALRRSVEELPGRQREVLAMMLSEPSLEYAEISRSLGIPHGSIGPTRQRGLARLRQDETLRALYQDAA